MLNSLQSLRYKYLSYQTNGMWLPCITVRCTCAMEELARLSGPAVGLVAVLLCVLACWLTHTIARRPWLHDGALR